MGIKHRTRKAESDTLMKIEGILPFTRSLIQQVVQPGDTVIDCTMGNGLDTLFLASQIGPAGTVLAYDIQQEALIKTKERLQHEGCLSQARLYLKGHQTVQEELDKLSSPIAAAMFNLGYRPQGDKKIVTKSSTTIAALHSIRGTLKKEGIITLIIYPGHEQGKMERDAILQEVQTWDQALFQILQYQFINQRNDPPFLIAIQKK
jgi:predicted methyltransferase